MNAATTLPPGHTRRAANDRRVRKATSSVSPERRVGAADRRSPRSAGRIPIPVPVRVRVENGDPITEVTVTKNISLRGLYMQSTKPFRVGQEVSVALYYSEKTPDFSFDQHGRVVRVDRSASESCGIAIQYT
jgi:hypothetical protein